MANACLRWRMKVEETSPLSGTAEVDAVYSPVNVFFDKDAVPHDSMQ